MTSSRYYLAALSAFAIWGFFSLVLKPLQAFAAIDILFYRVFLCAVVMVLINLFFRKKVMAENRELFRQMDRAEKIRTLFLSLGGGALLTANWFFFIYVMNHISIKAASFAYLICPILTTVLAYFILKETLSKWQWIAVALSLASCLLLSFHKLADIGYSMIVAVTYAFYLISQRKNKKLDKFLILTSQILFSALLLLPFFPKYGSVITGNPGFYLQIALIAIVFTILPLYLNLYALQGLRSSTIGILLYVNPLLNFVIALFHYHESITQLQILSYLLILVSIVIFNGKYLFPKKARI